MGGGRFGVHFDLNMSCSDMAALNDGEVRKWKSRTFSLGCATEGTGELTK